MTSRDKGVNIDEHRDETTNTDVKIHQQTASEIADTATRHLGQSAFDFEAPLWNFERLR